MLTKSKSLVFFIGPSKARELGNITVRKNRLHSITLAKVTSCTRVQIKRARSFLSPINNSQISIINNRPSQIRFVSSNTPLPTKPANGPSTNHQNDQKSSKFSNGINYTFAITIGTVAGLITGYILVTDSKQLENVNELSRSLLNAPKFVSSLKSITKLIIPLIQYKSFRFLFSG